MPACLLMHLTPRSGHSAGWAGALSGVWAMLLAGGEAGAQRAQTPIASTGRAAAATAVAPSIALVGATVIDVVTGERLADRVVLVSGGRITSLVPRAGWRPTAGIRVVSVAGKFIVPGLWDMHVEQALPLWDRQPIDSNAAFFHPLFLANGVTGVRDVAGSLAIVRGWRDAIERGARVGPRIVFSGPKVGMAAPEAGVPFPLTSAADVEATMTALAAGGSRIAYLFTAPAGLVEAVARAARQHGLSLEGNVPFTSSLRRQVSLGQRVVDHLDGVLLSSSRDEDGVRRTLKLVEEPTWWARWGWKLRVMQRPEYPTALALEQFSAPRAESLFTLLAARRVYQVPTLRMLGVLNRSGDSALRMPPAPLALRAPRAPWNGWPSRPHASDHPQAQVFTRLLWSVGAMSRAGVPFLAGSDTPNLYAAPGLALHDELALLVRAGLSPLEALRSATLRPAEYLAATDSLGMVAPGRVADLVVVSRDPLVDIAALRQVEQVMVRGRLYPADTLAAWRARATAKAGEIARYWRERKAP